MARERTLRGSDASAAANDEASVVVDFVGVDAWLACARSGPDQGDCERASAATPGGRIAALSMVTFGEGTPRVVPPSADSVAALVAAMKSWPDAASRAARFLPARVGGAPIQAFVVANGHPWGDAYVQGLEGSGPGLRLSKTGEPVIVLNALLIASGYRGKAADQAASAFGVLSHEVFHALFRRYRTQDPGWRAVPAEPPPRGTLALLMLDEGVAHFVARRERLLHEGFPRDRGSAALAALATAWRRLGSVSTGSAEAEEILRSAEQGSFWEKFGSITGMLFTYGTFRAFGDEGVKEAVRCGPGRLISLYSRATRHLADLPEFPDELRTRADGDEWFDLCRRSGPQE